MTKSKNTDIGDDSTSEVAIAQNICGVVMPISKTAQHETIHWLRVQQLIHRVIVGAGFIPQNVWEGSSVDRITPRILSNLFSVPILVCDISDLNPNVMLELGMRLTSKKPTIVVAQNGSTIPFDIKDFQTLFYPSDLNIIDMEQFFDELKLSIIEKYKAFDAGKYEPFLKDVEIDFLDVSGRAVPFETLVEKRLDAISARLDTISAREKFVIKDPATLTQKVIQKRAMSGALVEFDQDLYSADALIAAILDESSLFGTDLGSGKVIVSFGKPASDVAVKSIELALKKSGIDGTVKSVSEI